MGKRLFDLGASELSLGDTIGVGTAGHVKRLLRGFLDAGMSVDQLAMHFHDTYGQALANTHSALEQGITTFDASAGGLGGCPYAKSATGNLATEDLVWMLRGLGIETGVDLEQVVATSVWMAAQLGRPSPSAVVRALGEPTCPSGRHHARLLRSPHGHLGCACPRETLATAVHALRTEIGRMSRRRRLPAHRCAEDGDDLPPGPARPELQVAREARRPLPAPVAAGQPRPVPLPRRTGPARPGLGRAARATARATGTPSSGGSTAGPAPSIVSHEILAPAQPVHVARVMADLADSEVHVVYSARDLGRALPAAWQESIKQGRQWTFRKFLRRCENGKSWFLRAFDIPTVLGTWGADLTPDRMHVVTVPQRPSLGASARTRCGCGSARRSASTRPGRPWTASAPTLPSGWRRRSSSGS